MYRNDLFSKGTLSLAEDFIRVSRSYESTNYAGLLRSPHWWIAKRVWVLRGHRDRRLNDLRKRRTQLVRELHSRFEGVLYELFTQEHPAERFGDYLKQVWRRVQIAVVKMEDCRRFSGVLWDIHIELGPDIRALRPKFMLRQFVDEMPDSSPRTALRVLAYGGQYEPADVTFESMRYEWEAYTMLHKQVLARLDELKILTADELSPDHLLSLEKPEFQYHLWLFRWKDNNT